MFKPKFSQSVKILWYLGTAQTFQYLGSIQKLNLILGSNQIL